ncbi:MAG: LLM class flavin-dependent oxidoreductase [Acidimicrobiales bacterium]|jgi:alkanesulfonate monooxygenase SsuD/methylene tetrahydromethanopterin reductase-like flavin-dependent oxidoreductase (luciferase family)
MTQLPALSLAAVPSRRARTLELAKEIESRGFSGIYCPSLGDALGLCLSMAHETSTIEFGTSIVNIYARNVLDYAATASYINEIAEGRFRMGIGVSHAPANKQLGVNPGKPLGDIRDFVETMRAQPRITLPPITLATMRDKMIATATEISEGMVFANAARSAMPGSLERMPDVGDDFWIGNMIPTCVSDDREAAAAVNRKTLQFYVALPNYRNYWKQNGYQEEMEAVEAALAAGDRKAIPGLLTDEWLSDVTLYGPADEVRDGLQAWYDSGLKTPILVPSSATGGQFEAFQEIFSLFE